jgi:ubiquinone/menaquinone biosynthesis C-methylase UbiE
MRYDGYTKYDAQVAESYDQDRRNEDHWQTEQLFVETETAKGRLGRVLDLPVGTGRFLQYYKSADEIFGVDISPHMLEMATRRLDELTIPRARLIVGDALSLPYEDSYFDTVVCFRLAHLLPPEVLPKLFLELARVSRGRILLQVYASHARSNANWRKAIGSVARKLARVFPKSYAKPWSHIQSYSHTHLSLADASKSAKLTLIRSHPLGHYEGSSVEVLELTKR